MQVYHGSSGIKILAIVSVQVQTTNLWNPSPNVTANDVGESGSALFWAWSKQTAAPRVIVPTICTRSKRELVVNSENATKQHLLSWNRASHRRPNHDQHNSDSPSCETPRDFTKIPIIWLVGTFFARHTSSYVQKAAVGATHCPMIVDELNKHNRKIKVMWCDNCDGKTATLVRAVPRFVKYEYAPLAGQFQTSLRWQTSWPPVRYQGVSKPRKYKIKKSWQKIIACHNVSLLAIHR